MTDINELPKVSLIIPVKDRKEYLYHTLRTCMAQDYENFEIIVADDASTDGTKEMVRAMAAMDSRITFIDRPVRVGMRDNFEDALSRIKEGYVLALGGDDGVQPRGISRMVAKFQETGTKLLTWCAPEYCYPMDYYPNGHFSIYYKAGSHWVDSKEYLTRQTQMLCYINDIECPMFYIKGAAHISLIEKVKSRTIDGRFYSCPTPDGYSGIVLAGEVDKFYFSEESFTINGVSPSSQGIAYIKKDQKAVENSKEFFKFSESKMMHPILASQPYSPLLSLMTVDYLMTAKDLPGWNGDFPEIDMKEALRKGIDEMARSYDDTRMKRELIIMEEIAKQHNVVEEYHKMLRESKKYAVSRMDYKTAITRQRLYIDVLDLDIHNVFDASYAAYNVIRLRKKFGIKFYVKALLRSLEVYRLKKTKTRGDFLAELEFLDNYEKSKA